VGMRTRAQEPQERLGAPNTHSVQIVMVVLTLSNRLHLLWDSRLTVVLVAFKDHRLFQLLKEPSIDSSVQLRGTGNIGKVRKLIPHLRIMGSGLFSFDQPKSV
jgi:hypothetical protein